MLFSADKKTEANIILNYCMYLGLCLLNVHLTLFLANGKNAEVERN